MREEIRSVLERDGLEDAKERFDELYPERRDEFEIDMQAFGELSAEAMRTGDMATGQAIIAMVQQIARDMVAEQTAGAPSAPEDRAEVPRRRDGRPARAPAEAEGARAAEVRERLGEPRDDLDRFTGVYVDGEGDPRRGLFVAVRCDGYLVVGATWGDAQNWNLRSLGELEFETRTFDGTTIRFTFEIGPDGRPSTMTHTFEYFASPLTFSRSLADFGWPEACIEAGGR